MKKLLYVISILILCTFQLLGQPIEKKNIFITGGFGLPELLNLSVSYNVNQFRAGFFAGILPIPHNNIFSVGGDLYYHFAGKSSRSVLLN